jgi:hypothetical protein
MLFLGAAMAWRFKVEQLRTGDLPQMTRFVDPLSDLRVT